jgi:hypothetical protein
VKRNRLALALALVAALGLVAMAAIAFERRRIENNKAAETLRRLERIAYERQENGYPYPEYPTTCFVADANGAYDGHGPSIHVVDPSTVDPTPRILTLKEQDLEPFRRDAWGQPIRFRQPGPVHTHGWDVWSVGPNGIDEEGEGDDLLIGEDDVATVSSRSTKG